MILLQSIETFVTKHLSDLFHGDFTDLRAVKIHKHYLESVVFSWLNAKALFGSQDLHKPQTALRQMTGLGLLSCDVYRFFCEHEAILTTELPEQLGPYAPSVASIYESLLQKDFQVAESSVSYQTGKSVRDTAGAYYTPPKLAQALVDDIYKTYHQQGDGHSAAEILYMDFSCGCGEFYQAILQVLSKEEAVDTSDLCLRFWGVDIDPIALQIAICGLLPIVPSVRWREVIAHFHLGNPLICTNAEASYETKVQLFAQGRYYAAAMGFCEESALFKTKFDIVLGNPPWEKIRFEERKFFKLLCPRISAITQKAERSRAIQGLRETRPKLWKCYSDIATDYKAYSTLAKAHPMLQDSLRGELNTYALFTELALHALTPTGMLTLIVKSSLVTMPTYRDLFRAIAGEGHLISLFLFENIKRLFSIDSREKFCVLKAGKKHHSRIQLVAGLTDSQEIQTNPGIYLDYADLEKINPSSAMVPNVSSTQALEFLIQAHSDHPVFQEIYPDCHFGRIVHLTSHAAHIRPTLAEGYLPIYEGKFLYQYDARYSTFAGMPPAQRYSAKASARIQLQDGALKPSPVSRYFIDAKLWADLRANYPEDFSLCWRSLTSPTNHRTMVAMILPTLPTCQSIQLLQAPSGKTLLYLLGLFNSTCFDALIRLKMPGIDLTQSVIKQIPVPHPAALKQVVTFHGQTGTIEDLILWRVASLLRTEPWTQALVELYAPQEMVFLDAKQELDELFVLAYRFTDSQTKALLECSGIKL